MKSWLAAGSIALSLAFLWSGTVSAKDKEKEGPTLRWATTWAQAVAQSKERNAVIFATFHKDN